VSDTPLFCTIIVQAKADRTLSECRGRQILLEDISKT